MLKTIIYLIILFFTSSIYAEDYINQKINSNKVITTANSITGDIVSGILFSIERSGLNEFSIAYLSKDKIIYCGVISNDKKLYFNVIDEIYTYEKEDDVIYLNIFLYNNNHYIIHLEKYSYELIMNYFSNSKNILKFKLGYTDKKPYIFNKINSMQIFYYDNRNNVLKYKELDLDKFKIKEINGIKNIDDFMIYSDTITGNILSLWKLKNESKNIYISPMDKSFNGLSNIMQLKFKQNAKLPFNSINNQNINLIFVNDFQNSFLSFPYTSDVRNYSTEILPDTFKDYEINNYFMIGNVNIIFFKKTTIDNDRKYDDVKIGLFDNNFNLINQTALQGINGIVSNIKCFYSNNILYVFWLENQAGNSIIRYSIINL